MSYKDQLKQEYETAEDKIQFINDLRQYIHKELSVIKQPVDLVKWVDIDKVQPNDYNPNSVAKVEMSLLYKSIKHDGYTQPIVTVYDTELDKYIIVDGFHRYFVAKQQKDIQELNHHKIPVVVIDKDINERMSATVRHNRARGAHSVAGMGNLVFKMLDNGMSDKQICDELGMEPEEVLKLKHITGFSKLFKDVEYNKAWQSKSQILVKKKYKEETTNQVSSKE